MHFSVFKKPGELLADGAAVRISRKNCRHKSWGHLSALVHHLQPEILIWPLAVLPGSWYICARLQVRVGQNPTCGFVGFCFASCTRMTKWSTEVWLNNLPVATSRRVLQGDSLSLLQRWKTWRVGVVFIYACFLESTYQDEWHDRHKAGCSIVENVYTTIYALTNCRFRHFSVQRSTWWCICLLIF